MAKFLPTTYFRSVIEEGKKVIWPNRQTVTNHTIMVIAVVVVATLLFAGVDDLFQKLLLLAINR